MFVKHFDVLPGGLTLSAPALSPDLPLRPRAGGRVPVAQVLLLEAAEELNGMESRRHAQEDPRGGKGTPFCVSSGHATHPSGAKGLHAGFSSALFFSLILHSNCHTLDLQLRDHPGYKWGSVLRWTDSALEIHNVLCTSHVPWVRNNFKHNWQV